MGPQTYNPHGYQASSHGRVATRAQLLALCARLTPRAQFGSHPAMGVLLVFGAISGVAAFLLWAYGRPGWEGLACLALMVLINAVLGSLFALFCERHVETAGDSETQGHEPSQSTTNL